MSLRLEMLQIARLAPKLLGDASDLVVSFLREQLNDDGGFKNRAGVSDLYYTVFGMEALIALRADVPQPLIAQYLETFTDIQSLDMVHLCCLVRCWANLAPRLQDCLPRESLARQIETFRSRDGGYNTVKNSEHGTAYGSFLAVAGYQDARVEMPEAAKIADSLDRLRTEDRGYANDSDMPFGLTPSSAAVATLLRHLSVPVDAALGAWLLARCSPQGGFFATPLAPVPDLLSTATALHALAGMQVSFEAVKEPCLDFLDTLWTKRGSFFGTWDDETLDTEYTYYALLALGHLSL